MERIFLNLKKIFKATTLAVIMFASFLLVACGNPYDDIKIVLNTTNQNITLSLGDAQGSSTLIIATVQAPDIVSKELDVFAESNKISVKNVFANGVNSVTITAVDICTNVPVNFTTKEGGGKSTTIYVSVVLPIENIVETSNTSELFVVKGEEKILDVSKILDITPQNTTQTNMLMSLYGSYNDVSLTDNKLLVGEDFEGDRVQVQIQSEANSAVSAIVTLSVIEDLKIDSGSMKAYYTNSTLEINDLSKVIDIAKNDEAQNSVTVEFSVTTPFEIEVVPYMFSTQGFTSDFAGFNEYGLIKTEANKKTYRFILNAENKSGEDSFFFKVAYKDFNRFILSEEFEIKTFDVVTKLDVIVDGDVVTGERTYDVYDRYFERAGMEILPTVYPSTVPDDERNIIIELGLAAQNNYTFKKLSSQGDSNRVEDIVFVDGKYTLEYGDRFYVLANSKDSADAFFTLSSESNPQISQKFNLTAKEGASELEFTNDIVVGNTHYYYLTTNEEHVQQVHFSVNNATISDVDIYAQGNSFRVDGNVMQGTERGSYYFNIKSVKGAANETSDLIIRLGNGLSGSVKVECFAQLDKDSIALTTSSALYDASIGYKEFLDNKTIDGKDYTLEFYIAVQKGETTNLKATANTDIQVSYTFFDTLLGENDATSDEYKALNNFTKEGGMTDNANYLETSAIVRSLYLNSFGSIVATEVGKTWIKATVQGYELSLVNTKEIVSFDYYFLVETYIPVSTFALSRSNISLFALNTVGDANLVDTYANIGLTINKDATYTDVKWRNDNVAFADGENSITHRVNNEKVFTFTVNDLNSVTIEAFSTIYSYEQGGDLKFAHANELTFDFVALYTEFGVSHPINLRVKIKKAVQVEAIAVDNVNVEKGIYLEVGNNDKDIKFQILARANNSLEAGEPLNPNLIFEFMPSGSTSFEILAVDRNNGLITVKKNQLVGGTGLIRIAPSDRFINSIYNAGENDIAIYIPITIADGRDRNTAYRITSLSEIKNPTYHYILLNSVVSTQSMNVDEKFLIASEFSGGLYGCLVGSSQYSTIQTHKTLFGSLTKDAVIEDLIVTGEIASGFGGFIANINAGRITNVTVENLTEGGTYKPSTLTITEATTYVGGLVGQNNGVISNSYFFGKINGKQAASIVGGLVGQNRGEILACGVEFYNFPTISGGISAINVASALVGEMTSGSLTNSYAMSYVSEVSGEETEYLGLNVLDATQTSILIGAFSGGNVDKSFGFINEINTMFSVVSGTAEIQNAYILFRTSNSSIDGDYIYYGISDYDFTRILSDSVWQGLVSGQNYGFPYFKGMLIDKAPDIISTTLQTLENVLSLEGESVVFFYNTNQTLSKLEQAEMISLNTISFEKLLGTMNASGIRALSSESRVVSTYANSISITGLGKTTLTLFSKYDYTNSQTFVLYIINSLSNFKLSNNSIDFENGAIVNAKITDSLSIYGKVDESLLLVNKELLLNTDSLQLEFTSYEEYISGSGLGGYVFDTQRLFSETRQSEFKIDYVLSLANLASQYVSQTPDYDLEQINRILSVYKNGYFTLNLFKGADKIEFSANSATIEPSDIYNFEVSIFSDMEYLENATAELLAFDAVNNFTSQKLEVLSREYTSMTDPTTLVYILGLEGTEMFKVVIDLVSSTYYLSSSDLTQQTTNENLAVYFQHKFNVTINVVDSFKSFDFNDTDYKFTFYATSSLENVIHHNSKLVSQDFMLTLKSQSVISIDASHYLLASKTLRAIDGKNVSLIEYEQDANSIMTPTQEGMLEINLFPIYANFSQLSITYSTLSGENYDIKLSLLEKYNETYFTKSTTNFLSIDKGMIIYNNYDNNLFSSINTLYISTFIPESIDKDVVFEITIKAFDEDGEVVGSTAKFNIVVQYLSNAQITLGDGGNEVFALVKGGTEQISVTISAEQTLESLIVTGLTNTADANNFISISRLVETFNAQTNTKTYTSTLYVGKTATAENSSNYVTIEANVVWSIGGKEQHKTTRINVALVDFKINSVSLQSDKPESSEYTSYIGVESMLRFKFDVEDNLTALNGTNSALAEFLANSYYENISQIGVYSDYVVNYGFKGVKNLMSNLFYVHGNTTVQVMNANGSISTNDYFNFVVENDIIKVVGKRVGSVPMMINIPIKYPHATSMLVHNISFYFTINVEIYSDEDLPLIIDDEEGFYNALNGTQPQNYILMNDLYLTGYIPQDTTGFESLDGNNHTIHILSFGNNTTTVYKEAALFSTVTKDTTLKNIIVNTYHASAIAADTTHFISVDVAGFSIRNEGIIYNCHVVAHKADDSRPNLAVAPGLAVAYSQGQIDDTTESRIAGFVVENLGSITNSRVGGEYVSYASGGETQLNSFNISGQGDIAGFVYHNSGNIASSFAQNITITNNALSGVQTVTAGFVHSNAGHIQLSYVEGVGNNLSYSKSTAGISTTGISAGFVYNNSSSASIVDSYANILLASTNTVTSEQYSSGRLTSGFVYENNGKIERAYTASKIENAKTTQMNFIGVDSRGEMQNTGTISNSYYHNPTSDLDDAYALTSDKITVKRVLEPDLEENFYGFTFATTANSFDGVWYINSTGPKLVSANQIAISQRYIADAKRDAQTGEIISYKLPYVDGFAYGSVSNPIIIRNAQEFNQVFGGDHVNAGSNIAAYYNLTQKRVFGNYRIITDIDLSTLSTDTASGVKISSSNMSLYGGRLDGNMFTVSGLELVAKIDSTTFKNFGMFAKLEKNALIMNMEISVVGVSAVTSQNVGIIAGSVEDSHLINISVFASSTENAANVVGNNIVGGIVGKVAGESSLKNLSAQNINVTANSVSFSKTQKFNRDDASVANFNSNVSYAGGIAGVADIYDNDEKTILTHKNKMTLPTVTFLTVSGDMQISGSSVGGIIGFLGPQTLMKDVTFKLSAGKEQKLIAYNFSAGGIVGECYGDIDMARAEHEKALQTTIENSVSAYYSNPASSSVERGNMTLFEHSDKGKYTPQNIGGIVGEMFTGKIYHSYSKLNVRNEDAVNAGGVIGKIAYAQSMDENLIDIYEVYAFGDVYAESAVGGFAGYIDQNRTLSIEKLNLISYFSVVYDENTSSYILPNHIYDVYAHTGTTNIAPVALADLVIDNNGALSLNSQYSRYFLPNITMELNSDKLFAVKNVALTQTGSTGQLKTNSSYASLGTDIHYKMVNEEIQAILPLKDYVNAEVSGSEMDAYFRNSDWEPNYWRRYATDMLPRLVTNADLNIFYIYVAEDLQNMLYYPDATFIVVGQNGNGMVKIGNYIRATGIAVENFSGTLRGYDNSGNYGFDYENYAVTFIKSSTSGAKIYNLTIEYLGGASEYEENQGAFIGSAVGTTFENLTFKDCSLSALVTGGYSNIGLMTSSISGGYVSNITFENCHVIARAAADVEEVNVGLMTGKITTQDGVYMQVSDVTAYNRDGSAVANGMLTTNYVCIDPNGFNLGDVNLGTIAGFIDGYVLVFYTEQSAGDGVIKAIGVADTAGRVYSPDTKSETTNGIVIEVRGSGEIEKLSAGLMFGRASVLNLSYERSSGELKIVGAIRNSGTASLGSVTLGGYLGKSDSKAIITNSTGSTGTYMFVDCDINMTASSSTAGMLMGTSTEISELNSVDTYGSIKVKSNTSATYVGGMIGKTSEDTTISNAIVRTAINYEDTEQTSRSAIGGIIGFVDSTTSAISIGRDVFKTRFLGSIQVNAKDVAVGGIIGSFKENTSPLNKVEINGAVFGGDINVVKAENAYVGGIVGLANYADNNSLERIKQIKECFSYGDIKVQEITTKSYVGGIIGKASEATEINGNYSVATIKTNQTQTDSKFRVNAIVGEANGAKTTSSVQGGVLQINYYSNQLSLCLDENIQDSTGVECVNTYYYTNPQELASNQTPTMLSNLDLYLNTLGSYDRGTLAKDGSKLNPYKITSQTAGQYAIEMAEDSTTTKYYVLTEDLPENAISNANLKNSFVVGDGFTLLNTANSPFKEISEDSIISGVSVEASITSPSVVAVATNNTNYNSYGALAAVNKGQIYSCNVVENASQKIYAHSLISTSTTLENSVVGGFVGVNIGSISDSFVYGDITATASQNVSVAAFVGVNTGTITHSYANGSVTGAKAEAFTNNLATGKTYYSYTVSKTTSLIENQATVFGGVADNAVGCYYDIYATTVKSANAKVTQSITDKMAVADAKNLLPHEDSNTGIGTETKPTIFLVNSQNLHDTANVKFGYDYKINNGYPTFTGDAYKILTYMHKGDSGDFTQANPMEIPNIGKLQQINDIDSTANKYFALTTDINYNTHMQSARDIDVDIDNWLAIGTNSNSFGGYFNGEYTIPATQTEEAKQEKHTISNLNIGGLNTKDYAGLFGSTSRAEIKNLILDFNSTAITTNAKNIGAVAASADTTTITDVVVKNINFALTSNVDSDISMGAIVGAVSGLSLIKDVDLVKASLSISGSSSRLARIGAVAGYASTSSSQAQTTYGIENIDISSTLSIIYNAQGSSYIGAIVGDVSGNALNKSKVNTVTLPQSGDITLSVTSGSLSSLGMVAGRASHAEFAKCLSSSNKINQTISLSNGNAYVGAVVGQAESSTFDSVGMATGSSLTISAGGEVYAGMFAGQIQYSTIKNSIIGSNATVDIETSGGTYAGIIAGSMVDCEFNSFISNSNHKLEINADGNVVAGALFGYVSGASEDDQINLSSFDSPDNSTISISDKNNSSSNQSYVGGYIGSGEYVSVSSNFDYDISQLSYTASGKAYIGGLAGRVNTEANISNVDITFNENSIKFGQNANITFGGVVGHAGSDMTLTNPSVTFSSAMDKSSTTRLAGTLEFGGIVGNLEGKIDGGNVAGLSFSNCQLGNATIGGVAGICSGEIESITIASVALENTEATNSTLIFGGIVGRVSAGADIQDCSVAEATYKTINATVAYVAGLFGEVAGGTIKDCDAGTEAQKISFEEVRATSLGTGGAIGKISGSPNIESVTVTNFKTTFKDVEGSVYAGGIVSEISQGSLNLTSCSVNGAEFIVQNSDNSSANLSSYFGGITGQMTAGTLTSCSAKSIEFNFKNHNAGTAKLGGLVGVISNATLDKCSVDGVKCEYLSSARIYAGGFAGDASNVIAKGEAGATNKISSVELINAAEDEDGELGRVYTTKNNIAYLGGMFGYMNAGMEVDYVEFTDRANLINTTTNAAMGVGAGGISAYSNSLTNTFSNININAGVYAYNYAAGAISQGQATFESCTASGEIISGSDVSSRNSNPPIKMNNLQVVYAGGFMATASNVVVNACTNQCSVVSGFRLDWDESSKTKVYDQIMIGFMDNGGSEKSYAGGIVGYVQSSARFHNTIHQGHVEAKALVTVSGYSIHGDYLVGGVIQFRLYYVRQSEPAYACGIAYLNETAQINTITDDSTAGENGTAITPTSHFTNCQTIGAVKGGESVEFNMYWTNAPMTYEKTFFILDHGRVDGRFYNSWEYISRETFIYGAYTVFKMNSGSVKMVGYSSGGAMVDARYGQYGDESAQFVARSEADSGRLVYFAIIAGAEQQLYYKDSSDKLYYYTYFMGEEQENEYTGNNQQTFKVSDGSSGIEEAETDSHLYSYKFGNLGNDQYEWNGSYLQALHKTFNGNMDVLRDTSINGTSGAFTKVASLPLTAR